jgi:hypothetical protein
MAETNRSDDLLARLHAQGLRTRTAKLISEATDRGRKPTKGVERTVADMKKLVAEVEDRLSGGPEKRRAAAKKAAATRRRNAGRRTEAAKKAAHTRVKAT